MMKDSNIGRIGPVPSFIIDRDILDSLLPHDSPLLDPSFWKNCQKWACGLTSNGEMAQHGTVNSHHDGFNNQDRMDGIEIEEVVVNASKKTIASSTKSASVQSESPSIPLKRKKHPSEQLMQSSSSAKSKSKDKKSK
ncbi:hypothetical protein HDU76_002207, partial [Blyttiomyces sp. JEL0837]